MRASIRNLQPAAKAASSLALGTLRLDSPAVQAALSGYSDWPMRVIARRHGAAYALAEVMLDRFVLDQKSGRERTRHHLLVSDEEHPVGGQLMGADPKQFGPAARRLVEAGFDVVDINFGCPVRSALGRCRGGFHLGQPDVALDIIRQVRDATPDNRSVTVKMRRGIDDTRQSRDRFFQILDGAFDAGVAAITVHGRSVLQGYRGSSDWSFLREVKRHAGARVIIGSGDLFSAECCLRMLRETGVDGVSIARGAIGNPWIFTQVRALLNGEELPPPATVREQREVLREHFELSQRAYGPERCLPMMRKFGIKYARLHPEPTLVRDGFARTKTAADWQDVLRIHYAVDAPGCYPHVNEVTSESAGSGY